MALQDTDLLPLYRISDKSNRKISVANLQSSLAYRVPTVNSPPVNAQDGDLYWDEDDATLYLYYDNGGNPIWVPATPVPEGSGGPTGDIDAGVYA